MNDRGFILVNVLILVAALSVVAVGLLQLTTKATERLEVGHSTAQAPLMIDAGVAFARQLLEADAETSKVDHPNESWVLSNYVADTAIGPVRISVTDLESRMNINLPMAFDGRAMEPTLEATILEATNEPGIAAALVERYSRFRSDQPEAPNRNTEIVHQVGDVAHLVELFDPTAARDLFAAIPRDRGININTASDRVLSALPGMTPEVLAALNSARQTAPLLDEAEISNLLQQIAPDAEGLVPFFETQSFWFEVKTETALNGFSYRGRTVLVRDPQTGGMHVHHHMIEVDG